MKRRGFVDSLWVVLGNTKFFRFDCVKVRQGAENLKSEKPAMDAIAKRDVAGRLRALATSLSLNSDKTWLLRRAQEFEHRAAMLELQAVSVAARHSTESKLTVG